MEIIRHTTDFFLERPTAVAIGKFDGLHRGHRFLLQEILEQKKNGLTACVFTFDPPPSVFFGLTDGKELSTREEQRLLLREIGMDILIEFPMSAETASIPPEEFVAEILHRRMKAAFVAAGKDLSFGAKGAGDTELLMRMGKELDIRVDSIDKVMYGERAISSTYIRELVESGELELAACLLGAPYRILGRLGRRGNELALTPAPSKLLPPPGVYRGLLGLPDAGGLSEHSISAEILRRCPGTEKEGEELVIQADFQKQNEWLTSSAQIAIISLGCNKVVTKS